MLSESEEEPNVGVEELPDEGGVEIEISC